MKTIGEPQNTTSGRGFFSAAESDVDEPAAFLRKLVLFDSAPTLYIMSNVPRHGSQQEEWRMAPTAKPAPIPNRYQRRTRPSSRTDAPEVLGRGRAKAT